MWYEIVKQGIAEGIYTTVELNALKDTGLDSMVVSGDLTDEQSKELKAMIVLALGA